MAELQLRCAQRRKRRRPIRFAENVCAVAGDGIDVEQLLHRRRFDFHAPQAAAEMFVRCFGRHPWKPGRC